MYVNISTGRRNMWMQPDVSWKMEGFGIYIAILRRQGGQHYNTSFTNEGLIAGRNGGNKNELVELFQGTRSLYVGK